MAIFEFQEKQLHMLARQGDVNRMISLVDKGANVNNKDHSKVSRFLLWLCYKWPHSQRNAVAIH